MKGDLTIHGVQDPIYSLSAKEIANFPDDKAFSRQENLSVLSPRHPVSLRYLSETDPIKLADYATAITSQNACLKKKAEKDLLTGVFNRGTLDDMLRKSVARGFRNEHAVFVAMSDIDNFKNFNDTYGHQLGDDVLKGTSKAIEASLREEDVFGRYGGEEFALVLNNGITSQEVKNIVDRNRTLVENYKINHPEHGSPEITASFGVASTYESPECIALCSNPDDTRRGNLKTITDIVDATKYTTISTKSYSPTERKTADKIYKKALQSAQEAKLETTPENIASHIEAEKYKLAIGFLYELADKRLYKAKEAGKNCVIMK